MEVEAEPVEASSKKSWQGDSLSGAKRGERKSISLIA